MKKIIGLVLWLAALLVPFRHAILDTDEMMQADGRADNIPGLLSFVAMLALFFIGYALVDSSNAKTQAGH